jgi:hypothetical protein
MGSSNAVFYANWSLIPSPTFISIVPNEGPTAGNQAVTITGTNFVDGGSFGVTIGGVAATSVVRVNAGEITAVTPAHAAGSVDVVVTNNNGQFVTGTNAYTYYTDGLSPLVGDFSGDGIEQAVGLYHKDSAQFFLHWNNTYGEANNTFQFGWVDYSGDLLPLAGDWNNDGEDTIGLYQNSTGTFFLKNSNSAGDADMVFQFGPGGDDWVPVAGDWNSDGEDTIGLYQKSTGTFFLKNSNTYGDADNVFQFGIISSGDMVPIAGDWTGKGYDSVGLYQKSTGIFFLKDSNSAGDADNIFQFGPTGTGEIVPLAGDWTYSGKDTIGIYQHSTAIFFLKNSNTYGDADIAFVYGWVIT